MSDLKAGDRVRVNDQYLDRNLVNLEGAVRNVLADGCMVNLDDREQPFFFYEVELDRVEVPDDRWDGASVSSDFRAFDEFHIGVDPAVSGGEAQVLAKPLTDLGGPWHLLGNAIDAPPHFTVNVPERQVQYRIVGTWEDETHGNEVVGPVCGDLEAALIELRKAFPEVDETWELTVEERVVTETSWKGSPLEVPEDPRDKRIEELEHEVKEWRGNHAGVVNSKRKLHQRFDDLFRAKSQSPLEALGELERLIRQLEKSNSFHPYVVSGYDEARDDVIDLITDLAQELTCRNP